MSAHCELCDTTLGDGWCRNCAKEANLASKDAEIERLRKALMVLAHDPYMPGAYIREISVEALEGEVDDPNRAAGATPHPRSDRSGDPE